MGFISNGLVVYVMLQLLSEKLKSSVKAKCIFHMSIADIIFVLGLPFLVATLEKSYWPFGDLMCKFYIGSVVFSETSKALFLALLTITCYAKYKDNVFELTKRKVSILLSICWILGAIIAFPILFYTFENSCNVWWPETDSFTWSEAFLVISFICVFCLPIGLLALLIYTTKTDPKSRDETTDMMELIKVLLYVHLACRTLHVLAQFMVTFGKSAPGIPLPTWKLSFALISACFWTASSFVFPIIYYVKEKDIKSALKSLFLDPSKDAYRMVHYQEARSPTK